MAEARFHPANDFHWTFPYSTGEYSLSSSGKHFPYSTGGHSPIQPESIFFLHPKWPPPILWDSKLNVLAQCPSFQEDIGELQQEEDDQDKQSHQEMLVKEPEGEGQDDDHSVKNQDDEGTL